MKRKITISFTVCDEDMAEVHGKLGHDSTDNPQKMLVDFLQRALYDDEDGPMLEGNFDVIGNIEKQE